MDETPSPITIFTEAMAKESDAERASYLDLVCSGNSALRAEVESLLKSAPTGDFLDRPLITPPDTGEGVGATIGPFRLIEELGKGGMGTVFLAEQDQPVRRRVAIKVIRAGLDSPQVVARFEAERQALAMMDHPCIAKVLDAGATAEGRAYVAMELVEGRPITAYCDEHRLVPRQRLGLLIEVCRAIEHAHQKGVIHRDLKPSNVLVTEVDGRPVPKVIDFGVAKAIGPQLTERVLATEFGSVVGTLEYMSPEQASLGEVDVDTRSDVYSLGVLLYELLAGSTPLGHVETQMAALLEVLRRIREEEPPKPSSRLSDLKDGMAAVAATRGLEPSRLTKLVSGELDWVVMKALEKERDRRYASATDLARDLRCYLDGDPVKASPPSKLYRVRKYARKHRAALAITAAFALMLLVATGVSLRLAYWANRERVRALKAEESAKVQKERALEREQLAIDVAKRYADAIRETPEWMNNPAFAPRRARLLGDSQEFLKMLRERLQADNDTTPGSLSRLATAGFELGQLTEQIGDRREALRAYREALAIFERLARDNPSDAETKHHLAACYNNIGNILSDTSERTEALESLERARIIFEQLARDNPSVVSHQLDLASSYNNIGNHLINTIRRSEALDSFERGRQIYERLATEYPSVPDYQHSLASILYNIGGTQHRHEQAMASFGRARMIQERLVSQYPSVALYRSKLARTLNRIGVKQSETGQFTESLESHHLARTIRERLAKDSPSVTEYQDDLADTYQNIGVQLSEAPGRLAEALETYERAIEIRERLARDNPSLIGFQRKLAILYTNIGIALGKIGRSTEELKSYELARAIYERLVRDNPSSSDYQSELALCLDSIGLFQSETGRPTEAMESYKQALAIHERLVREQPGSPDFACHLGRTIYLMAKIDLSRKQFAEAQTKLTKAIELQRKALAVNPSHPMYRRFLENQLTDLIQAAEGQGLAEESTEARHQLDELRGSPPQLAALDVRLSAIIMGTATPNDDAERMQLAYRSHAKGLYAASARLFAEALSNVPKLADDRQAQHRYNAACAAALAGCGKGMDTPAPDEASKARLRQRAREWLTQELAVWGKLAESGAEQDRKIASKTLEYWKQDVDLNGIRDAAALSRLSESERAGFRQLWDELDRLLAESSRTQ